MERGQRKKYFLAIQVTNEEIKRNVREIQNHILEKEKNLAHAMEEIESLHLTLGIYDLEDEKVTQAAEALDRFHNELKISDFTPPSISVSGVKDFDHHQVVYASVEEDKGLEDLNTLVENVRKSLRKDGFVAKYNNFRPHITIGKMSKNMPKLQKLGIRRIEPTHYEEKKTVFFGKQTAESIQLCSMTKSESGYYNIVHEIKFQLPEDKEVQ